MTPYVKTGSLAASSYSLDAVRDVLANGAHEVRFTGYEAGATYEVPKKFPARLDR